MKKTHTVGILASALCAALLPKVARAAPTTFSDLVFQVVAVIDRIVPVLIAATVVVYFWRIATNVIIFSKRPDKEGKGGGAAQRKALLDGLLVIFVMVSIWGILRLFVSTFLVG